MKVEPRIANKPLYTVRDLWFQVVDKKFLDSLKEKTQTTQILNGGGAGASIEAFGRTKSQPIPVE